jgi:hypothetical protein
VIREAKKRGRYLDDAEAIAAESEVVDAVAEAAIAKVECLLAMKRRSGIGIRDSLNMLDVQDMKYIPPKSSPCHSC